MGSLLLFAFFRLVTALPVLRWPLAGALIAVLGDLTDLFLFQFLGEDWNYQALDKYFDLFYLSTFLIVALRWQKLERRVALLLFAYRIVGFALFEATHWRPLLFAFPNVFEFWFIAVAALHHFRPTWQWTPRRIALWLALLTATKLAQEYLLHIWRPLDRYTATEFLARLWHSLTPF